MGWVGGEMGKGCRLSPGEYSLGQCGYDGWCEIGTFSIDLFGQDDIIKVVTEKHSVFQKSRFIISIYSWEKIKEFKSFLP